MTREQAEKFLPTYQRIYHIASIKDTDVKGQVVIEYDCLTKEGRKRVRRS